jgi:hypothetical protein
MGIRSSFGSRPRVNRRKLGRNLRSPIAQSFEKLGDVPSVPGFPVTVSSNEARHILIQKTLTQQVLIAISPAG